MRDAPWMQAATSAWGMLALGSRVICRLRGVFGMWNVLLSLIAVMLVHDFVLE